MTNINIFSLYPGFICAMGCYETDQNTLYCVKKGCVEELESRRYLTSEGSVLLNEHVLVQFVMNYHEVHINKDS